MIKIYVIWLIFLPCYSSIITRDDIIQAFDEVCQKFTGNQKQIENHTEKEFSCLISNRHLTQCPKNQELLLEVTRILSQRFNLAPWEVKRLRNVNLHSILPNVIPECSKNLNEIKCDEFYPYRTFDGTCNNLRYPARGMINSCFNRMLYPAYSDGVSGLRKSVYGNELPEPRAVSLGIDPDKNIISETNFTLILAQFGQFIVHDLSLILNPAVMDFDSRTSIDCCAMNSSHIPQCAPISISDTDPFYSKYKITCLNNARSDACKTCSLGPREQRNYASSVLDGSVIYGYSQEIADQLRNFDGKGTLKFTFDKDAGELLSQSFHPNQDRCSFQMMSKKCFEGSDFRINQQIMASTYHTSFLRHHNNIARKLFSLHNGYWDEEKIYQVTRKIVTAQLQMIVYNELLPKIIGEKAMKFYQLYVKKDIAYTIYNPTINPTINNEFIASAYRFGHSLISNVIPEVFSDGITTERLQDVFFYPFNLYKKGFIEAVIKGMSICPVQKFDRFLAEDVTNHLYQLRDGNKTGLDLVSLDIFREREHGIPPYVDVVKYCSRRIITSFEDLRPLFREGSVEPYMKVYKNVADIELLSAGYSEIPMRNAIVGPTLACVIGEQFRKLKYGDRFYFEHGRQIGSLTPDELMEIKKITFSKIICDNTNIEKIQGDAMRIPSSTNPIQSCKSFPEINLSVFK